MKSKILLFTLVSICILSCKSDDESPQNPTDGKLLSHIDWETDDKIEFTYNDDRTIKTINISEDIILHFSYTNNRIETLIFQWGQAGGSDIYRYTYDDNSKINSISKGEETFTVTYQSAEQSYQYEPDEGESVKIFMEDEDVRRLLVDYGPDTYTYAYQYLESKGPIAGSNACSLHIIMALPDPLIAYILNCFSKKTIQSYQDGDNNLEFENELDENSVLISRDYQDYNGEPATDVFNYTQL